jgi:hypothetical protein
VINNGLALAGALRRRHGCRGHRRRMLGAVLKDPVQDRAPWQEYLETVVKERDGWKDLYRACRAPDADGVISLVGTPRWSRPSR